MRRYRVAARLAAAAQRAGAIVASDPRLREFNRLMLKVPEHTWGCASGCAGDYTNAQLDNPAYSCHPGAAQYNATVGSWTDQSDYIEAAVAALAGVEPLHGDVVAALAASEPSAPTAAGMAPFDVASGPVATVGGALVQFNASGCITKLSGGGGQAWADTSHPLGLLRYATHSEAELAAFASAYTLEACRDACGNCAFSKCGLNKAGAESGHHVPTVAGAWADAAAGRFLFNLTWGAAAAELTGKYGAPLYATLEVTLAAVASSGGGSAVVLNVTFDLQWWEKRSTRMAESVWMTFNPLVADGSGHEGWQMDKLDKWVDPLAVVTNGSKTMHAVWSGVRHRVAATGVTDVLIASLDAPVVMPGDSLAPAGAFNQGDSGEPHPERGWSFNLFNNVRASPGRA